MGSGESYHLKWEGKTYEDKGQILRLEPEKIFESTYWSSMGGLDDIPENYNTVTYTLEEKDDQTEITVAQDNNPTKEGRDHAEKNWGMVLDFPKIAIRRGKGAFTLVSECPIFIMIVDRLGKVT